MKTMKYLSITLLLLLSLAGEVIAGTPPYLTKEDTRLDQFIVELYNTTAEAWLDRVTVRTNNATYADVYDSKKGDAVDMGAQNEDMAIRKNTFIEGVLIPTLQTRIVMPYDENYFFDVSLVLKQMQSGKDYYLKLSRDLAEERAVKAVQIIDPVTGTVSDNMLSDDGVTFEFTVPSGVTSFEFIIRVYGGEPFKVTSGSDGETNLWSNPANWFSGKLPDENSHVVIPEGVQTIIAEQDNVKVSHLTNLGTIVNNGTLEVTEFIEVSSNK